MYNCIFTGHCIEEQNCNSSCPILAQTSYLLERNEIKMTSPVFKMNPQDLAKYAKVIENSEGRTTAVSVAKGTFTNLAADALTYCAICDNWKGSQLHCTVYNLKFNKYLDTVKSSWSFGDESGDDVSQIKIWVSSAKVLIISNIDFINFKDFQSQSLLSLLQAREGTGLTTIVVTPPINSLVGEGQFFSRLTSMLQSQKVGENL